MKFSILITTILIAIIGQSCTKESISNPSAPEIVQSSFNTKFPDAKKVKWDKDGESSWEAEFKMNTTKYSSNFTSEGVWEETEYEIKVSEVPVNIIGILDENFTNYKIEEAEISETMSGDFKSSQLVKSYELEIEVGDDEFEVAIDENGILTKELEDDDDDDDNDDDDNDDDDNGDDDNGDDDNDDNE